MLLTLFLLWCLICFPSKLNSVGEMRNEKDISAIVKTLEYNKYVDNILTQIGEKDTIAYQNGESIPIFSPIKLLSIKDISSDFGWRRHPILFIRLKHNGIDIEASLGTHVQSTADGVVIIARKTRCGYGNEVVIRHSDNYETRYAHLDFITVKVGQTVKRGTFIGTVGVTGLTTGPHLHYEILKNGNFLDPMFFTYQDKKQRSKNNYYFTLVTLENV